MLFNVSATPIHKGQVIGDTRATGLTSGTNEEIGFVISQAIANARKLGFNLTDPETWVRVEFRLRS